MYYVPNKYQIICFLAMCSIVDTACVFNSVTQYCDTTGLRCGPNQVCAPHQGICVDIGSCGDGSIDDDVEECDDGNLIDGDGCDRNCSITGCGNGVLTAGEECDNGLSNSDDGICLPNCRSARCGDGKIQKDIEECDDGINNINTGECLTDCRLPKCGDGYVRDGVEMCDDGNANRCGTCDAVCTTRLPKQATGSIAIVDVHSILDGAWFDLENARFAYRKTDMPMPMVTVPIDIKNVSDYDLMTWNSATVNILNSSPFSSVTAEFVAANTVKLTAKAFGEGGNKGIAYDSTLGLQVGAMTGGVGVECANGTGCRSDRDCRSGNCDSNTLTCNMRR